ncbi:uncharacterized protein PgNI_02731 [Pyricularia grisea]|uniref:Uncharacterized protein n=1 Tax=Pyricularia grisea TaxID=148305 RepID=A0A6P8BCK3_PYRGI|nr:uncharacterized protein PgNI_02731 [Pyricularia grisea]TLD13528.1 hypothetical protein PgNI_02731 [Pyricularia grisea]
MNPEEDHTFQVTFWDEEYTEILFSHQRILGIGGSGCGRLNPRRSSSTASISVVPPPTLQFCAKHGIGITRFGGLRITHREGWDDWTEGSLLAGRWLGRASCYCCTC